MMDKNPCPWWTLNHWLWYIRQPGHHCHRLYWGWGIVDGPIYWIYYCSIFAIYWDERSGWSWGGFNFD